MSALNTQHLETLMSTKVHSKVNNVEQKIDDGRIRVKDKNDRATVE